MAGMSFVGGLLLENIVQAIARDILFEGMLRLRDAGFELVAHVHDEAVAEIDLDKIDVKQAKAEFVRLLTIPPDWMPDVPLSAKAWVGHRFDKITPDGEDGGAPAVADVPVPQALSTLQEPQPPEPEPAPAPQPTPPAPLPSPAVPMVEETNKTGQDEEESIFAVLKAQIYLPNFIGGTRVHCPFHDPEGTRSASVQVYADGFKCFASDCEMHGDIFDWVQEVEDVDRDEAIDIVSRWHGEHHQSKSGTRIGAERDAAARQRAADLWRYARPLIGSLGEKYLVEDRGVDVEQIPDIHDVLRFHSDCPLGKSASGVMRYGPAIIALFRDALTDQACAIHRIGLTRDGHKLERQMLGKWPNARAVKLWRSVEPVLVISEGIETGAAAGTVKRIKPVWALGSAGAIKTFPIIPGVRCLYVLVDNDPTGRAAALACAQRWKAAGNRVVLLPPKEIGFDANDVVRQQRVRHVSV